MFSVYSQKKSIFWCTQLPHGLALGMLDTGLYSLYKNLNELHLCIKDKKTITMITTTNTRVADSQWRKFVLGRQEKSKGNSAPWQVAEIMACP